MSISLQQRRAGAILTIDLKALEDNWRLFSTRALASKSESGAVVKASAYGLDVHRVAPVLVKAGCKTFFVASIDEAITLRDVIGLGPSIHVFHGLMDGAERDFTNHHLVPVLNTLSEIGAWRAFCAGVGQALPCDLHIDTGMSRLGLDPQEFSTLVKSSDLLAGLNIDIAMSHMASSEDPKNPGNAQQLKAFKAALSSINPARRSLANSSAVFLGPDYHFDLVRPGGALYGSNPTPGLANPMKPVIRLQAKVLQVQTIDSLQGVGYGSTHQATKGTKIATLAVGYADGLLRSLSNVGEVYFGEHKAPIVGRVSMDLITVDVTAVPQDLTRPGHLADIIGPNNPIDDVADKAGTIGYELLTQLGSRYHRVYTGENSSS